MKRLISMLILFFLPVIMYSQEKKNPAQSNESVQSKASASSNAPKTEIPVQAQYSKDFKLTNVFFNRTTDFKGRGEILEVEFVMENLTDEPIDFYMFAIATFEKTEKTKSSFEKPIPPKERLRSFVPYPADKKNFQYAVMDEQGNIQKDRYGREMYTFYKYPHDPKAGINPETGKLYTLKNKLFIRTYHLSEYRNNYFFFNNVAILIFARNGKLDFRQLYELNGYRR